MEEKENPHLPDRKVEGFKWCQQEDGQENKKAYCFCYKI